MNNSANKVVVITGASSGIGQAIALHLANNAFSLVLVARRLDRINALVDQIIQQGGKAIAVKADVTRQEEVQRAIDAADNAYKRIDVLINNAGGLVARKPVAEIDDAFFADVINLNVRSAQMLTRFALPHLKAAAQASGETSAVILVGSVAAHLGGGPGASLYGGAKAWLHNVQKNWVSYHTADGIRFNTVSPGTFDTAFHADKSAEVKARISTGIPMGRFGRAEECAPAFLFLASHACAGYITGQTIEVNGGQYMP